MTEKILLVDDDLNILSGYQRSLHREFQLETASSGSEALQMIAHKGPYAVVVSDMRMPNMDGIQLLAKVKNQCPETVRIMLTGNSDIETAIQAVNEGNIFRFLAKPCDKELLAKTLTAALLQYRLVTAERELLERTLHGSIQVLTEVLSLVNPAAFGRAMRARRYIHHLVQSLSLENAWQYEIAALMSQLGCVTLPPEIIDSVYAGKQLSPEEKAQYDAHPSIANDLLCKIPRLEPIAWMIRYQADEPPFDGDITDRQKADMRMGAEILHLTLAYEKLISQGISRTEAAHTLARRYKRFSPRVFQALVELDPNAEEREVRRCWVHELTPGMIVQEDVRTMSGLLVVSKGQEVTAPVILKLNNFFAKKAITGDMVVSLPRPATAAAGAT
ncbi:MAG TPA: HD domain-containing phosphohydrolase [Terriglobales bacterium]|nr:HD domain-containing phosphohydrolase [Terriglobales bacterium]